MRHSEAPLNLYYLDGLREVQEGGFTPEELETIVYFIKREGCPKLHRMGDSLRSELIDAARMRSRYEDFEKKNVPIRRICKKVRRLSYFGLVCLHLWGILASDATRLKPPKVRKYAKALHEGEWAAVAESFLRSWLAKEGVLEETGFKNYVKRHSSSVLYRIAESIEKIRNDYPGLTMLVWAEIV